MNDLLKFTLRLQKLILFFLYILQSLIVDLELILQHIDLIDELWDLFVNDALILLLQSRHIIHMFVFEVLDIQQV